MDDMDIQNLSGDLNDLSIHDLELWCEKFKLPTKGSKSALVLQIQSMLPSTSAFAASLRSEAPLNSKTTVLPASGAPNDGITEQADDENSEMATASNIDAVITLRDEIENQQAGNDHLMCEAGNTEEIAHGTSSFVNETLNGIRFCKENEKNNVKATTQSSIVDFSTVKEFIPEYDGEKNVNEWLTVAKNVRAVFNISDDIMRPLICARAKGKANYWLLSQPSLLSGDIDDIFSQMQIRFGTKGNLVELRQSLEKRKWLNDEVFASYFYDKQMLANKLNVTDDEMVQYILEGIPNVELRNQGKLQRFATPAAVLDAFRDI